VSGPAGKKRIGEFKQNISPSTHAANAAGFGWRNGG
jgi:hypothetical protein